LQISPISDSVVCCQFCKLTQFERGNGQCRRCHHPLGFTYIEFFLSPLPTSIDSQSLIAMRLKVGALIRRLRCRRGITQAALASLSGVNRSYISRAEHGKVTPSVIALMQIAGALGVSKLMLRLRSSSASS
jgi:DNA-binding XRE family transcriptional regulator